MTSAYKGVSIEKRDEIDSLERVYSKVIGDVVLV